MESISGAGRGAGCPELVRVAGLRGQSCFHHLDLSPVINWDQSRVALVPVIRVAGLRIAVFFTHGALAGGEHLVMQLHFGRVTFFTAERQNKLVGQFPSNAVSMSVLAGASYRVSSCSKC